MTQFLCDLSQTGKPFDHFWEHTVGSGHAPLALRADWQVQLDDCRRALGFQRVRFHDLLSGAIEIPTGEKEEGVTSFFNVDQIVDFLRRIEMRPFVELSFMPRALASGGKTTFHYRANVTPPQDHDRWAELVGSLVKHWLNRYGRDEVRQWHFEVWNEPNWEQFWTGGQMGYFKLYRQTVEVIKALDPELKVGGPASAQNEWIPEFLDYCQRTGTAVDFISTHNYPNDDVAEEGGTIEEQLARVSRDVLVQKARSTVDQAQGLPVLMTEWNSSSQYGSEIHDRPYSAVFAVRTLMNLQGLVEAYSFWTFSDIFEELGFPSSPFHGGFGLATIHNIPKPTYRAFQLLHGLGSEQLPVSGQHGTVEVWAVRSGAELQLLLTNHAMPGHPIAAEQVQLRLSNAAEPSYVRVSRIDDEHAHARRVWEEMGSPVNLDPEQLAALQDASRLNWRPLDYQLQQGQVELDVNIPPYAVVAVSIGTE
jgi:xylan 1,4-beta-xylosidase